MHKKSWRNEDVHKAFDELIKLSEQSIAFQNFRYKDLKGNVLRERVIQRIVQLTFYPYCIKCTKRFKNGQYPLPTDDKSLLLDGIIIHCKDGKLSVTKRMRLRLLGDYLLEWVKILAYVFKGFFGRKDPKANPSIWVFGLNRAGVIAGGDVSAFELFCKEGPASALLRNGNLIVQEGTKGKSGLSFLSFAKNPVHYHIYKSRIGIGKRIVLLLNCFFNPFLFLLSTARNPLLLVLAKDYIQYPLVRLLDEQNLIGAIVITNSNFFQQPLWMRGPEQRHFRVHELHYSQNTIPFLYKSNPTSVAFPAFRHVRVDEHWVWTEGYKTVIRESGHQGPIHVVGPIVWYLPEKIIEKKFNTFQIAVFDVTPIYQSVADKMGVIHYYYTTDKLIEFVETVIEICESLAAFSGVACKILLKSKRHFTEGLHDKLYIDYLDTVSEKHPSVEILDPRVNIFSLLNSCDFSVSMPYTSVPYVAAYLKKNAAYYDPRGELIFTNEPSPFLTTASSKEELKKIIAASLKIQLN